MAEALSFQGQTKESYCAECMEKHSQTAKVFMREALQRAEVCGNASCEGVIEKVRGIAEELAGYEADSQTTENEDITALNTVARDIRKHIFSIQAEIGQASIEQLHEVKEMIDLLVDKTYDVRQRVDCPTCKVNVKQEEKQPEKPSLEQYGKPVSEARRKFIEEIRADLGA